MKNILNTSYLVFFSIYCAVIPFTDLGEAIPNIILVIILLLFPFVVKKADWYEVKNISYYLIFLLILITTVQFLYFNRLEDYKFVFRLILIIIILIFSIPIKGNLIPIVSFISGALILLLWSSFRLIIYYTISGKIDMTVGEQVSDILLGDRPYIGYIYVVSFCMCLFIANRVKKKSYLFYFLAIVFFIYIFIISARISILSLFIIISVYLFYAQNVKRAVAIFFALILFCSLLFAFNHSLRKRLFLSSNNYTLEQLIRFEPRYYIWTCGFSIPQQNISYLLGHGFVSVNKQLEKCYKDSEDFMNEKQQAFFYRSKFNSHNQFLSFYLSSGTITLMIFLFFFIFWLKKSKKNHFVISLILGLFLFCLVENVLSRQMGVELFSITLIFSSIIILSEKKQND